MAYTAADLTTVQRARLALAAGERVVSIATSDGVSTQYQQGDDARLQTLEAQITRELAASSSSRSRSYFVVTTGKGF